MVEVQTILAVVIEAPAAACGEMTWRVAPDVPVQTPQAPPPTPAPPHARAKAIAPGVAACAAYEIADHPSKGQFPLTHAYQLPATPLWLERVWLDAALGHLLPGVSCAPPSRLFARVPTHLLGPALLHLVKELIRETGD